MPLAISGGIFVHEADRGLRSWKPLSRNGTAAVFEKMSRCSMDPVREKILLRDKLGGLFDLPERLIVQM